MSRKWERMVEKNKNKVNQQRLKQGKTLIHQSDSEIKFYGRNWFTPALIFIVMFSYIFIYAQDSKGNFFWFTVCTYILVSLYLFFIRRPNLWVSNSYLSSLRIGGQKYLSPTEIEKIEIYKDAISIIPKGRKARWVFSKSFHRFPVTEMSDKLIEFASKHHILFIKE